jgi:hypothetical protein
LMEKYISGGHITLWSYITTNPSPPHKKLP